MIQYLVFGLQSGADACTGDGGGPLMCPLAQQPNVMPQVISALLSNLIINAVQLQYLREYY
jgi:hypothetical protein